MKATHPINVLLENGEAYVYTGQHYRFNEKNQDKITKNHGRLRGIRLTSRSLFKKSNLGISLKSREREKEIEGERGGERAREGERGRERDRREKEVEREVREREGEGEMIHVDRWSLRVTTRRPHDNKSIVEHNLAENSANRLPAPNNGTPRLKSDDDDDDDEKLMMMNLQC